jgi:hypothetical protein
MFCFYYKNVIVKHLDSNTPLPAGAVEHIAACESCGSLYGSHMAIARQMEQEFDAGDSALPDHLREKIILACSQTAPDKASGGVRRLPVALSIAAAVLIAAGVWFVANHFNSDTDIPNTVEKLGRPGGGSLAVAWLVTRGQVTPGAVAVEADEKLDKPDEIAEQLAEKIESWYADFQEFCTVHQHMRQQK